MSKLKWNSAMAQASQYHCDDKGPQGTKGHESSDGTRMSSKDRLMRFGSIGGFCGENISYGQTDSMAVIL